MHINLHVSRYMYCHTMNAPPQLVVPRTIHDTTEELVN